MEKQESNESDVSLSLLLRNAHREMMKGVHTMLPGIVESFDPISQRAKVNLSTAQEAMDGSKISFPPLINVPVQFFRWGGFTISTPIIPGDECCVVFSERSMDTFLQQGGKDTVPNDARFFDLSDAFILPGLNSDTNIVPDYDPANLVMKSDTGTVKLTMTPAGALTIESTLNTEIDATLNTVLKGGNGANTTEVRATGGFRSTNATAELVTTLNTLLGLIQTNEVLVEWPVPAQNLYAAQMVNLATFLV